MASEAETIFDSVFSVYLVVAIVVWALMMLRWQNTTGIQFIAWNIQANKIEQPELKSCGIIVGSKKAAFQKSGRYLSFA